MRASITLLALLAVTTSRDGHTEAPSAGGKPPASNIYSPVGKRDPFKSPPTEGLTRDLAAVNPIERFSVEQLQLRAILKGIGNPRAMFEDPEGKTFIVTEGDVIGRERGTISRIENTDVIITERTFNYLGVENLFEKVISLPPGSEVGSFEMSTGGRRPDSTPLPLPPPSAGAVPVPQPIQTPAAPPASSLPAAVAPTPTPAAVPQAQPSMPAAPVVPGAPSNVVPRGESNVIF